MLDSQKLKFGITIKMYQNYQRESSSAKYIKKIVEIHFLFILELIWSGEIKKGIAQDYSDYSSEITLLKKGPECSQNSISPNRDSESS
jgi:hypothetical protein